MADIEVALLGTGIMGLGMGRSMRRAGLTVRAWNRTRSHAEPLAEVGATIADTPADAIAGAGVVVTMFSNGDATESVMADAITSFGPDATWAQMGTIGLEATDRLLGLAREHDVAMVDAPVSGTKEPAEEGKLVVLAAGPAAAVRRATPVFEAVGSRTVDLGEQVGDGMRMKLIINSWLLDLLAGLGESLSFARALGLDPAAFLDAIKGGPLDAPYVQLKGQHITGDDFSASFPLVHAHKDARLMLEAASAAGTELPLGRLIERQLSRAEDEGHGADDVSALVTMSGQAG